MEKIPASIQALMSALGIWQPQLILGMAAALCEGHIDEPRRKATISAFQDIVLDTSFPDGMKNNTSAVLALVTIAASMETSGKEAGEITAFLLDVAKESLVAWEVRGYVCTNINQIWDKRSSRDLAQLVDAGLQEALNTQPSMSLRTLINQAILGIPKEWSQNAV